jgi:hypothetical protein
MMSQSTKIAKAGQDLEVCPQLNRGSHLNGIAQWTNDSDCEQFIVGTVANALLTRPVRGSWRV